MDNLKLCGVATAGVVLGYLIAQRRPRASHPNAHVLLVELGFDSEESRNSFTASWSPLASRVYKDEPNCLSYEMCNAVEDNTKVIIYERYATKADLDGAHQVSLAEHRKTAKMGAAPTLKKLTHYTETNIGHMDR